MRSKTLLGRGADAPVSAPLLQIVLSHKIQAALTGDGLPPALPVAAKKSSWEAYNGTSKTVAEYAQSS